jgi:hypothetical protein
VAVFRRHGYILSVARHLKDLQRLADELASLSPEERARVTDEETRRRRQTPDWAKNVERISVSASTLKRIEKEFRSPSRPTRALRKLMSGRK